MNADEIIRTLRLQPHPREDGYFVETYRASDRVTFDALPGAYGGARCFSTAIYFLLKAGGFSEMHRLRSDEVFHYYSGAPAEMLLLYPDGSGRTLRLGCNLPEESPQVVVPRGVWQGMITTGEYTLFGCTVSPGFEYEDYESGRRDQLENAYPEFAKQIRRLTR